MALLQDRESELERLRAAVDEPGADINAGRYSEYTDETLPHLLDELKAAGTAWRETRQRASLADGRISSYEES